MDLALHPDDRAFADEVRTFVRDHLPDDIRASWADTANVLFAPREQTLRWTKILHERGWSAPIWPRAYGGPGWSVIRRFLFETETALAGAPPLQNQGLKMVGPVIMHYGTLEQKRRFLPRIVSGEDYWCQGYSEPNSGSDLAALGMRAERRGDEYVLNGRKIWTTCAHEADWHFCLARTDSSGRKQEGITFLLVDMKTPGIAVRPLPFMTGTHEFNETFFDAVRVPVANRVGAEGEGWAIAKYLLEHERGGAFLSHRVRAHLDRVRRTAAWARQNGVPTSEDAAFRRRFGELEMAAEAMSWTELRLLDRVARGEQPGPESSITKLLGARLHHEVTELGMQVAGPLAVLIADPVDAFGSNLDAAAPNLIASASARYFNHRANSIMGGTDEVQRSILAKGVLGL